MCLMSTSHAHEPSRADRETRRRVLEAAAGLFAERGYPNVTIRDICAAAGANVAAVNYYFHDKWGLYEELIRMIVEDSCRLQEAAHASPPETPPEVRLRNYIHAFLKQGLTTEEGNWRSKLMAREMTDPTPGLDLFIEQVIRPNSDRVGALIAELMGLPRSDWRVGACVGSVQTQMVGYFGPVVKRIVPALKFTPQVIEAIAEHITRFSLAGIRAVASADEGEMKVSPHLSADGEREKEK
jgi:TetR/AcrR family transcriptional regulator, regulator of cefoperazone and chloramphenicol sensitivity